MAWLDKSWQVGTIAAFPINISSTWFLIVVPIAASLAVGYMPARYPDLSAASAWAVGVSATCFLFASVLAHELAHAVVARRNGLPVASINLFMFGGVAVLRREPATAWTEAKMAAVGPLCSLGLGLLLALLYLALGGAWPASPVLALVEYLAVVNLALALFNLLPAFPLDGGRLLRAAIWALSGDLKRATWAASGLAQGLALLLIAWGLFRLVSGAISEGAPPASWPTSTWIVMTGWFLCEAARAGNGEDGREPSPGEEETAGEAQGRGHLP